MNTATTGSRELRLNRVVLPPGRLAIETRYRAVERVDGYWIYEPK